MEATVQRWLARAPGQRLDRLLVSTTWRHRLVRAEVDLSKGCIRYYTLPRREPKRQPLVVGKTGQVDRQHMYMGEKAMGEKAGDG